MCIVVLTKQKSFSLKTGLIYIKIIIKKKLSGLYYHENILYEVSRTKYEL